MLANASRPWVKVAVDAPLRNTKVIIFLQTWSDVVAPRVNLATKRLLAACLCYAVALGVMVYGVNAFYLDQLVLPELTRSLAVALLLVGMGLAPQLFFMSVSQIISQPENMTLTAKLQGYLFNLGVFLLICSLLMEWLYHQG